MMTIPDNFDTMYAVDKKGKPIYYKVTVEQIEGHVGLITEHTGQYGGKDKVKKTLVKTGKNLGKANATTPFEQAQKDAASRYEKKRREGYKSLGEYLMKFQISYDEYETAYGNIVELFEAKNVWYNTDHNDRPKPMLAHKYKQHKNKVEYPCFIQPKLNGIRCTTDMKSPLGMMFTREGENYPVAHIIEELKLLKDWLIENDYELDGELYCHGMPLNEIVHNIRTPNVETAKIKFVVYDFVDTDKTSFITKTFDLNDLIDAYELNYIQYCPTIAVRNEDDLMNYHKEFISQGYEGSMVRASYEHYEPGFRSHSLLKIKESISEEFEIVDAVLPESGIVEDFNWLCTLKNGKTFKVKAHGTVAQRREWFENKNDFIGKSLSLTFHEYSKEGFPFHIHEVIIRDYE